MRVRSCVVLMLCLALAGCAKTRPTADLLNDLKAPQQRERATAVRLLALRKADAAQIVPALIETLQDKEGDIRRSAALGLGSFGEHAKDAIPALLKAKDDPDVRVRQAASTALSRIDPAQLPPAEPHP